jgi:hypothetical protein
MDTTKLINIFENKLKKVSELRGLGDASNPEFVTWWNTVTSTCERMGKSYKQKTDSITFTPSFISWDGDESAEFARAYERGLDQAVALIKSIIEVLETWGYEAETKSTHGVVKSSEGKITLNLAISQQQVQQISQTINLAQYDADVQEKVEELLGELKKENKDKARIVSIVKWLADKGVDALIAILLASARI